MIDYSRIDEVSEILDELAMEIPKDFYNKLNRGIVLSENIKYHPDAVADELVVLGEYSRDMTGNGIYIYYGSFMKMFGHLSHEALKRELNGVLLHEFTHHLEFLAGVNDLVVEDHENLRKFKKNK